MSDLQLRPPWVAIARQQQTCPRCQLTITGGQVIAHFEDQRWMHWLCAFVDRGLEPQPLNLTDVPSADLDAVTATTAVAPRVWRGTRDDAVMAVKRAGTRGEWVRLRFHRQADRGQHYEIEEPDA